MPHWRSMMDEKEYLYAHDLLGQDRTVTIEKVWGTDVVGEGGSKSKKPILKFEGKEKKLVLNVTNCKTIAQLYGNDTAAWEGKKIILFPTTTQAKGGGVVDCIRVRPKEPA